MFEEYDMQMEKNKTLKIMYKLTTKLKYCVHGAFARRFKCLGINLVAVQ